MEMKQKTKEKGITLVALVITIVILIILSTITINVAFGEGGLIEKAQQAKNLTEQATLKEQESLNSLISEYANIMAEDENTPTEPEEPEEPPIDKVNSKVGYYADIDGDKTVDGIIYADLAVAKSGQWSDSDGAYSYSAITNTKDYYVSQTNYEGPFGTKDVLTAMDGDGQDRFYVMALTDFNPGTYYCWYADAYDNMNDYATATSGNFGTGSTNTGTMISKWNGSVYGTQNTGSYSDMWGAIQDEVAKGWFVPSRGEWSAFADNLGITDENYGDYGLSAYYWSSSQNNSNNACNAAFNLGCINFNDVNYYNYVRLSTTF